MVVDLVLMLCCVSLLQARLEQDIAFKQQLREQVSHQLENDMTKFKEMEREAAALIAKARHSNSKLMVRTSSTSWANESLRQQLLMPG